MRQIEIKLYFAHLYKRYASNATVHNVTRFLHVSTNLILQLGLYTLTLTSCKSRVLSCDDCHFLYLSYWCEDTVLVNTCLEIRSYGRATFLNNYHLLRFRRRLKTVTQLTTWLFLHTLLECAKSYFSALACTDTESRVKTLVMLCQGCQMPNTYKGRLRLRFVRADSMCSKPSAATVYRLNVQQYKPPISLDAANCVFRVCRSIYLCTSSLVQMLHGSPPPTQRRKNGHWDRWWLLLHVVSALHCSRY